MKYLSSETKSDDVFSTHNEMRRQALSPRNLVIPVCNGHHWILVIVRTAPNISLMIFYSLYQKRTFAERRKITYLRDLRDQWST